VLATTRARSAAERARLEAEATAGSFIAQEKVMRRLSAVLRHLLRLETMERALSGKPKLILPPDGEAPAISLWQPIPAPGLEQEEGP
jgi:hypothetical protein